MSEAIEIPRAPGPEDVHRAAEELANRLRAAAAPLGADLATEAGWRKLAFHLIAHHAPRAQIAALLNDPERLATFSGIGGPDLPAPCRVALQVATQHEPACRVDFSGRAKWFKQRHAEGVPNTHRPEVVSAFAMIVDAVAEGQVDRFDSIRTAALERAQKEHAPKNPRRAAAAGSWKRISLSALRKHLGEYEKEMAHVAASDIRAEGGSALGEIDTADLYNWFAAPDHVVVEIEEGRTRVRLAGGRRQIEPPPAEVHEERREAQLARDWLSAVNQVADAAARLVLAP